MTDIERARQDATSHGDKKIEFSRTFDVPAAELFKAWTDPKLMARWFAPEPMTVPKVEIDARPGGSFIFVMRDPDGTDFASTGEYLEVDEARRIVYRDSVGDMPTSFLDVINQARGKAPGTPVPDGIVTVTFDESGGTTKMTFSEEFDSKSTRDAWVEMQMVEGFQQGLDQLEKVMHEHAVAK
jgi:uncharacterized protein YndB with AHSA1/START domain